MKSFFSQVKVLLLGNGIAQLIQLSSLFLISRLYKPDEFGELAKLQSISTVLVVLVTLQLHVSVPLLKDIKNVKLRIREIEIISLVLTLISLPLCFYFGYLSLGASFLALILGLSNTYNSYFVFLGGFGKLAYYYILRSVGIVFLQILLSLLNIPHGLIIACLLGEFIAFVYLRVYLSKESQFSSLFVTVKIKAIARSIKENQSFTLFGTIQEFISVSTFYVPIFILSHKFGESIAGQYSMANRLVWAPVVLLSSSIAQVIYHHLGKQERITRYWEGGSSRKIIALIVLGVFLSFHLESVYVFFLGEQWDLASRIIPLQVLWGGAFLIVTPNRLGFRVFKKQHIQVILESFILLLLLVSVFLDFLTPMTTMYYVTIIFIFHNVMIYVLSELFIRKDRLEQ